MNKLSNYIRLTIGYENSDKPEYLVVVTKKKSKYFLVNEVIYSFLKQFEVPCNLSTVLLNYSKALKIQGEGDLKTLKNQLQLFFDELKKRKWIVKENAFEPLFKLETQFKIDDVISNYKIKSIIANKKETDLYLVENRNTKLLFVLKLLNSCKFYEEQSFQKAKNHLEKEYNFLTKFNTSNISKAFKLDYYEKQPFIVLEYIKGVSLNRFIDETTLKSQEKFRLVLKLLKGFSTIHQADVYHGDIHLSNVLVKQNHHVKIIDFGYANHVNNRNEKDNRNGGVYAYIPPERALRSLDQRFTKVAQFQSEVYQIGLLLYFIYVRDMPFSAETWKTMVDEKKTFDIKTIQPFLKRRMPKKVRSFIVKSLEREPKNRFENAKQMYKEWQKIKPNS